MVNFFSDFRDLVKFLKLFHPTKNHPRGRRDHRPCETAFNFKGKSTPIRFRGVGYDAYVN